MQFAQVGNSHDRQRFRKWRDNPAGPNSHTCLSSSQCSHFRVICLRQIGFSQYQRPATFSSTCTSFFAMHLHISHLGNAQSVQRGRTIRNLFSAPDQNALLGFVCLHSWHSSRVVCDFTASRSVGAESCCFRHSWHVHDPMPSTVVEYLPFRGLSVF